MSLLAEMNQKALNLGVPTGVHLDTTYRFARCAPLLLAAVCLAASFPG